MNTTDILWYVSGGGFLISLFTILYLARRGSLQMIDDDKEFKEECK